jgi:cytidine deaminase
MTKHIMITHSIRDKLIAAACEVRKNAYAPYSRFMVGAAVLAEDERIFTGVNVENASYGLTVCAERTAVGTMVAEGWQRILAVAVCTENGVTPCGACRQVLSEFVDSDADIPVWIADGRGNVGETTLFTLIPDRFGQKHLPKD